MNRRDFFKRTGLTAAAVWLGSGAAVEPTPVEPVTQTAHLDGLIYSMPGQPQIRRIGDVMEIVPAQDLAHLRAFGVISAATMREKLGLLYESDEVDGLLMGTDLD